MSNSPSAGEDAREGFVGDSETFVKGNFIEKVCLVFFERLKPYVDENPGPKSSTWSLCSSKVTEQTVVNQRKLWAAICEI